MDKTDQMIESLRKLTTYLHDAEELIRKKLGSLPPDLEWLSHVSTAAKRSDAAEKHATTNGGKNRTGC